MTNQWKVWNGESRPPVANDANVEVKLRDGTLLQRTAGSIVWVNDTDMDTDVVAWRLAHEPKADTINSPSHYTNGKVEAIDAIEAATTGLEGIEAVCTGNLLKYIWRWKLKNGIEDLKKARWYLDRLIAKVEKDA